MYGSKDFECSSTRFTSIVVQQTKRVWSTALSKLLSSYQIKYAALTGTKTDPITITCNYWRNPITPEKYTGFTIQTFDKNDFLMDITSSFEFDASTYTPYTIADSEVTYTIPTKTV